jgi:regulator of protease activity HflC (stomatin/prohibitin superfamily)
MSEHHNIPEDSRRRKASADFVVKNTEVDSSLELRDAMETAHRSLTDSLQLSFRALQIVMVVLLVLYLVSGFRTVEDSQTGVSTLFGAIVDDKALLPGLQMNWPPPVGGFEIYKAQNRESNVGPIFKPQIDARLSPEQRITKSKSSDGLRPGIDGSLLTGNGDLAHIEVEAEWEIVDPIQYASQIPDAQGIAIINVILEQSLVHIVSEITLEDLLTKPLEELRSLIQIEAQDALNQLQCGIRITDVSIPSEPEPPLYIQRSYAAFDSARIDAETGVEKATAQAHETLIEAAGSKYEELLTLINQFEQASESDDISTKNSALQGINNLLHAKDISGKVAFRIASAEGYRAQIETTLGQDFKRFQSLLPTYREHPELVIRSRWFDMYTAVVGRSDVETIFVPEEMKSISLGISGSDAVAQLRHRNNLIHKESLNILDGTMMNPWILRAREIDLEGPARELSIVDGVVQGRKE